MECTTRNIAHKRTERKRNKEPYIEGNILETTYVTSHLSLRIKYNFFLNGLLKLLENKLRTNNIVKLNHDEICIFGVLFGVYGWQGYGKLQLDTIDDNRHETQRPILALVHFV